MNPTTPVPSFSVVVSIWFLLLNATSIHAEQAQLDAVDEAVAYAETKLAVDRTRKQTAIVYRFTYPDDTQEPASVRFYCGSGYNPAKAPPDTFLVEFVRVCSRGSKLWIEQRGFHQAHHPFETVSGAVVVIDDIVLQPVTARDAAKVVGRLVLEGEQDLNGIWVRLGQYETKTDAHGSFSFENIPTGEMYMSASVPEYARIGKRLNVRSASKLDVTLRGYLKRTAHVRWAYQPNGTRDLANGLQVGESILGDTRNSRIVWADGFAPARKSTDFGIRQVKDHLFLDFTNCHRLGPGAIRLADITFEEVRQAPKVEYPDKQRPINEGDIFILKTLDGEHYGKLEFLEIQLGESGRTRILSNLARQELK